MKPLIINFVLPAFSSKPSGGVKIMFEYANRLALRGHKVQILYCVKKAFRKTQSPIYFKFLKSYIQFSIQKPWFPFCKDIKFKLILDLTDKYTPNADATITTWWELTYRLEKLNKQKGAKFNLIQGYEVWKGFENKVIESYNLNVEHLVVSKYLEEKVKKHGTKTPILLPNAIDTSKFYITNLVEKRINNHIIMLYSEEEIKGTKYGLMALEKVKKSIPDLTVSLFGVFNTPNNLPDYISYYQKPDNLLELYNNAKIFISPSLGEGWALPPAEAMACGCAIICTNIGGHIDYALNNETAITVASKNVNELAEKIILVINDDKLRVNLAETGYKNIINFFSWESSVNKLEQLLIKHNNN